MATPTAPTKIMKALKTFAGHGQEGLHKKGLAFATTPQNSEHYSRSGLAVAIAGPPSEEDSRKAVEADAKIPAEDKAANRGGKNRRSVAPAETKETPAGTAHATAKK
jgi:hypothetical protein